jgi:hypothetical protein
MPYSENPLKGITMNTFQDLLPIAASISALIMLSYALVLAVIDQRPQKDPNKR